MNLKTLSVGCAVAALSLMMTAPAQAQMGRRWPSEKKIVPDPVTGVPLEFLTSTDDGASQSKIYQTHRQWTSDGKWIIFRGNRGTGSQAFAVNEETGDIVQVTETGFVGMLCAGNKTMKLWVMAGGGGPGGGRGGRGRGAATTPAAGGEAAPAEAAAAGGGRGGRGQGGPRQILEIDLEKLLPDALAGKVKSADAYTRVCGTVPPGLNADGNMGLDANDDFMYFRVSGPETAQLSPGQELARTFGPRNMGAGPSGLRRMNLKTGEVTMICNVGFQIGHVQSNPWVPNEVIFCWETGGKAPQRTWFVHGDGTGLRPLYAEASYDWVTHEAFITKDEAAIAIIGHRGMNTTAQSDWGLSGTKEHATGVGIVNLRTREMQLVGQVPSWSEGRSIWHVGGSADGRWAAADDFSYELWVIDRHSGEMTLLAGPQKVGADHIHPTFNADSTKIEIQSALISKDGRALNICVVPMPKSLLARTYPLKIAE